MRFFKAGLILTFAAFALFCVGYAHSATKAVDVQTYSTHHWFKANGELQVRNDGSTVYFTPSSESRTRFAAFWPQVPGSIEIPAIQREPSDSGEKLVRETLTITFAKIDGEIAPVGYRYASDTSGTIERQDLSRD
jgi:hypothetical protein